MPGVFPDVALGTMLANWITGMGPMTLHLARNNVTITRASLLVDFTECNFSGYSAQAVGAFGSPVLDGTNHRSVITGTPNIFQNTTGVVGNDVYAIYITEDTGGTLVYAEEVTGGPTTPVDMNTAGRVYSYTPIFDESSRFSTSP